MNTNNKKNTLTPADSQTIELMEKAAAFLKSGKYEEAINFYDKVIQTDPQNIEALSLKANSLLELKRYDEAVIYYNKLIEIGPEYLDVYVWNNIGSAFFDLKDYSKAIEYYDQAIKIDEHFSWAWRNKGLALQNLLKYEEAIECYNKAIAIDPNYVDVLNDKGNILFDLGDKTGALKCYDEAIAKDPGHIWAWFNKGLALYNLKRIDEALSCYDKAIEIDPNNFSLWNDKGNMLFDISNYYEAISCYEKAVDLNPDFIDGWINKAFALSRLGKKEEAKQIYRKVVEAFGKELKLDPLNSELWVRKAITHENIDEYNEAENCFKEAEKIDPENIDAQRGLGRIYSDVKFDFVKGLEFSRERLNNKNHDFADEVTLVENLLKAGNYKEALDWALKLLEKATTDHDKCLLGFFLFSSYVFEANWEQANKTFDSLFQHYWSLPEDFVIDKNNWVFDGLINAFTKSSLSLQSKFMLLTIIDLFQGNIKRQGLVFNQAILHPA